MEIKKHAVTHCHAHAKFMYHCHECLVESVVKLCELLDNHAEIAEEDPTGTATSLQEVFEGLHISQFTDGWITNITALPVTPEDLVSETIRYTVEFRKSQ